MEVPGKIMGVIPVFRFLCKVEWTDATLGALQYCATTNTALNKSIIPAHNMSFILFLTIFTVSFNNKIQYPLRGIKFILKAYLTNQKMII